MRETNYVYIVKYDDTLDAVYDEETFFKIYKQYVDKSGRYWESLTDVYFCQLNSDLVTFLSVMEVEYKINKVKNVQAT